MIETMNDLMSLLTVIAILVLILFSLFGHTKKEKVRKTHINQNEYYRVFDDIEDEDIY